jgi:hypothetical protein
VSTALTLAVSFTGHPEYPLAAGAAVLIGIGAAWPGPGSAWSRLRRRRARRLEAAPSAEHEPLKPGTVT